MSTETTSTDTPTEPAAGTLTRDDVAALRAARSIGFYRTGGATYVLAFLDDWDGRILTRREQVLFPSTGTASGGRNRRIDVPGKVRGYGQSGGMEWSGISEPAAELFALVYTSGDVFRTVVDHLRAGDVLSFTGIADNNTDVIRAAGLHHDELRVHLTRAGKTSTYLADSRVSPDNSARMIKRYGSPGIRKG